MSEFQIEFSQQAANYLRRLDKTQKQRIASKLRDVCADCEAHSKRLVNRDGTRSTRVGDLRILFDNDDSNRRILVIAIRPRGDVYKHGQR